MSSFDFSQFSNSAATNPVPIRPEQSTESNLWDDNSITYVTITQDRLSNNQRNFPVILPYVDRAVVVDGFSKDGTYEYLKSLGDKVTVVPRS